MSREIEAICKRHRERVEVGGLDGMLVLTDVQAYPARYGDIDVGFSFYAPSMLDLTNIILILDNFGDIKTYRILEGKKGTTYSIRIENTQRNINRTLLAIEKECYRLIY